MLWSIRVRRRTRNFLLSKPRGDRGAVPAGAGERVPDEVRNLLFLFLSSPALVDVTVLGLVGGAPGGETPRVADSSAALLLSTSATPRLASVLYR